LYLGVSKWVYPHATDTLYLKNRPNIVINSKDSVESYNSTLTKIKGMTGAHAILFISRKYIGFFINKMTDILNHNDSMPHDLLLGSLQHQFNIYALKKPMFYQDSSLGGQESLTKLLYDDNSFINV
jgi:hypothetical protein